MTTHATYATAAIAAGIDATVVLACWFAVIASKHRRTA